MGLDISDFANGFGASSSAGGGVASANFINIVSSYNVDNTGGTDSTAKEQLALNTIAAQGGGTAYYPPGTYKRTTAGMTLTSFKTPGVTTVQYGVLVPSNVMIFLDPQATVDFSSFPSGQSYSAFMILGSQAQINAAGFSGLSAAAKPGDTSITVNDGTQFAAGQWIKLASYRFWDPGSRNQWIGEIIQIASVSGNTVTLQSPVVGGPYIPGPAVAPTSTSLQVTALSTDTTIFALDTTQYRQAMAGQPGVIQIDTEQISYTARTFDRFMGCTRAYNGTTAAGHTAGATITELGWQPGTTTGSVGIADTTIPMSVTTGYRSGKTVVQIDSELIYSTGISGGSLQNCTRGYGGTTAATHNASVPVIESDGGFAAVINPISNVGFIGGGTINGPNFTTADNNTFIGIQSQWCNRLRINNIRFINCKNNAFASYNNWDFEVAGCTIIGSDRNNFGYGVSLCFSEQDYRIHDNYIQQCRHGITHGGGIDTHGVPRRGLIHDNHVVNTLSAGIDWHSGGGEDHVCHHNTIVGAQGGGINVNHSSVTLDGNTMVNCLTGGIIASNITAQPTKYQFINNKIRKCTGSAISASISNSGSYPAGGYDMRHVAITDNLIEGMAAGAGGNYGIVVGGGTGGSGVTPIWDSVEIAGNTVRDIQNSTYQGIYIGNAVGASVHDNKIRNCHYQGIIIQNVQQATIHANQVIGQQGGGSNPGINVIASGCSDLVITGNTIRNYGTGIGLDNSATNCIVQHNNVRGITTPISMGSGTGHIQLSTDNTNQPNRN